MMIDIWTRCLDSLVVIVVMFFAALFALKTTEGFVRWLRSSMPAARSPFSVFICILFLIAAVDCGADKVSLRLTSWLAAALTSDGLGDACPNEEGTEVVSPSNSASCEISDCFVSSVQVLTNALVADVSRDASGALPIEQVDVFFTYSLTTNWCLLPGYYGFAAGETNTVAVIGLVDMPCAPTNMPSAAFVQFGRQIDSDEDGLYDLGELRLYGTASDEWDTDGDGLGDGMEIAAGIDPCRVDSDEDGYDDDEERLCGSNPLVPDSGAQRTIRYYYDDDFLSATYFECHAVKMTLSHDGNAVRCEDRRRPVSQ